MPGVARSVSTAHALLAIVSDRSTATARVLEMYGVTADSVSEDLQKFAVGDDFRTEVQVHMLDFGEENKAGEKSPAHLLDLSLIHIFGFVELRARKALGQELLLGEMPDVVVSVFIALAVARLVHQAGRGVAQV